MKKMLSALTINKGAAAIKPSHGFTSQAVTASLTPDVHHQTIRHCSHPNDAPRGDLGWKKQRPLALDSWGTYQRNDFSEFGCLNLPKHRKVLNSLTWNVWFSSIHSNLLMFWLYLVFAYSYISWILTWLFRAVPYSYQRGCILGLSPQFCLLSKT